MGELYNKKEENICTLKMDRYRNRRQSKLKEYKLDDMRLEQAVPAKMARISLHIMH